MSATRRLWQRPALRTDEQFELHRAVSWLELFFDLVFVVVISRLAHQLAGHPAPAEMAGFVVQFLAIFWVWNAFTYYTERFESDGLENRLFTFLAIIPVAGLAVFAVDGLGAQFTGFGVAYLLARAVNMLGWLRAGRHVPVFRPVMRRFLGGFGIAAVLVLAGFAVPPGERLVLFGLAVVVEICTPALTVRQQSALPPLSTSKFPERFGLLTMIVLGEAVVGVIVGLSGLAEHAAALTAAEIISGALGLALGFGLWWLYFDFIARRAPRPVFLTALLWVYLHMAVLIGITTAGAGISLTIADSSAQGLTPPAQYLLVAGIVLSLLAVAALELTLTRAPDEPTHPRLSPALKVGVAAMLGLIGSLDLGWSTPALLATLLAGLCLPMAYGGYVWYVRELSAEAATT